MFRKVFFAPPLLVAFVLIGLIALPVLTVQAQGVGTGVLRVNCDKGDSIQETIRKSWEHTTIEVSGTCNEHVELNKDRISIIGKPGAVLSAPSGSFSVIAVRGRSVRIKNFEIDATGLVNGIHVNGGAWVTIEDNTIKNSDFSGITVRDGSFGDINHNQIVDNGGHGIFLFIGASANIIGNTIQNSGNLGIAPTAGSYALIIDNEIRNSGAGGIWIGGKSGATINFNIIEGNTHSGVGVVESGSADISGNTISDNEHSGVYIARNSSIAMPPWSGGENLIEDNGHYGILCDKSGSMIGIAQNFGDGNDMGDEKIEPGCDKIGF